MTAPGGSVVVLVPNTDPTNLGNWPGDGPLRAGGQQMSSLPSTDENLPSALSASAKTQSEAVTMLRDLWIGTERVRARESIYLPQAPGEDSVNYQSRLKRSVFFNVIRHTVEVLAGFPFRRDPLLGDDVPAQIVADCENIDLAGTHLDVFARNLLQDALIVGHTAILVEYPDTGGERLTLADEEPLRPYWVPIKKENILSWRTTVEDGKTILTQVVLRESAMVPNGMFGEKEQVRYRVLYRNGGDNEETEPVVGWQLLEVSPAKIVSLVDEGLYGNQVEIPLVEVPSAGRKGLFDSEPPMLDLAYLNVAHYQQWSDYAFAIHKTCVPVLFTAGVEMKGDSGAAVVIGPNSGVHAGDPGARMEYVSHGGQALGAAKDSLDDLKNEMAVLGVAMLATRKKSPETAEAKRIDRGSFDSALSVTARALQDAIERAFALHARYYKLDAGGSIRINRDFENMTMQPDMLASYVQAVSMAGLPVSILLQAMQEGGLIQPDVDLEALEAQMMANQIAKQDQAQAEAEALAAAKSGMMPAKPPMPKAA